MMKKLFLMVLPLVVSAVAILHVYSFRPVPQDGQGGGELIRVSFQNVTSDIYSTAVTLANVPEAMVKAFAIEVALPLYVHSLPLEVELRDRVLERLGDERYMKQLVPFVWSLKEHYTPPENMEELTFDNFLRQRFLDQKIPGGEHDYFQWEAQANGAGGKGLKFSRQIAGKLLELYDILFIQDDFDLLMTQELSTPYRRVKSVEDPVIARVKPLVRELLEHLVSEQENFNSESAKDGEKSSSEISHAFSQLLKDDNKMEAMTLSLVDFVRMLAQKSYRMFALRFVRRADFGKWAKESFRSGNYQALRSYFEYQLKQKHYGVHLVVDGLQGELMRTLQGGRPGGQFLQMVKEDFSKATARRPKKTAVQTPDHPHTLKFFEHLLKTGYSHQNYLPFFRNLYDQYDSTIAQMGISTSPTISVRNLPLVKTGAEVAGPGGTGIPNFHFVDRAADRGYYFFGNDALLLDELTEKRGMKSMFQRLQGVSTMNCFAQYDWYSQSTYDGLLNLAMGESVRDFGEILCHRDLAKRAKRQKQIDVKIEELLAALDIYTKASSHEFWVYYPLGIQIRNQLEGLTAMLDEGLPQYLLYYFPWPDHFAHFVGPFSDEIISPTGELNRLDYWLGKLTRYYEEAGLAGRTLYGMAGDHGLMPIFYHLNPEVEVLDQLAKEKGRPLVVEKISSDEGEGPKINHALDPKSMKGIDVVIASTAGGNYMMDFFHQGERWKEQPLYGDLTKWTPLSGGQSLNIVEEIRSRLQDTLEYLVVRDEPCEVSQATIRLVGTRHGQRYDELLFRNGQRIFYKESSGKLLDLTRVSRYRPSASPLELDRLRRVCLIEARVEDPQSWCTEQQWRELSFHTDRPDAVVQLAHLYDDDRSGTVNLFPLPGIGFNTKVPGRHAGEMFHEKDAWVGFWGEPTKKVSKPLRWAVNGSIAPTLYEWLTGEKVEVGKDGWGFPALPVTEK